MIFCITVLRALAAILITNSHYTGVYPTDIIANGELLGDVIFFAVSGFCLYNVKIGFGKWYLRRIARVYPAPIIITAVYMLIGFYAAPQNIGEVVGWFIYPTNYHFVASIVLLYIPFYFVAKFEKLRKNILWVMLGVLVAYLLVYIFVYDRSYYHIDNVREPMIRFLFFISMLLGAYFKQNFEEFKNKFRIWDLIIAFAVFVLYFITKIMLSKAKMPSEFQVINQAVLIALLYMVMKCFAGIDSRLEKMPFPIKKIITLISEITLEIYVVQYAIIPRLAGCFGFPVNWIVITGAILVSATLLHLCVKLVNKGTDKLFSGKGSV